MFCLVSVDLKQHRASQTFFCARPDWRVALLPPGRRGDSRAGWLGGCSTCKVPFFHEQQGTAAPIVSTWTNQSDGTRAACGKHVLWRAVTGVSMRIGITGPAKPLWVSILSFPTGGMTLVRSRGAAARLPASPGSRLFGHVTTILVT